MPDDEQPVAPEQAASTQPAAPQVSATMTPQGLALTVQLPPVGIMVSNETLAQIALQFIAAHPELADEIVKQRVAFLKEQRQQLQMVQHIKRSKIN